MLRGPHGGAARPALFADFRQGRQHGRSTLTVRTQATAQTASATVLAIGELAAELKAAGVQMMPVEAARGYWRVWVRHEVALSE